MPSKASGFQRDSSLTATKRNEKSSSYIWFGLLVSTVEFKESMCFSQINKQEKLTLNKQCPTYA